jgi:hypothetical protein
MKQIVLEHLANKASKSWNEGEALVLKATERWSEQFHHHHARVIHTNPVYIGDGCYREYHILQSYDTLVAIVEGNHLYMVDTQRYSNSTTRQITRFIREYC